MTKSRHGAASRTAPFTPLQGQYLAFMHTYEDISIKLRISSAALPPLERRQSSASDRQQSQLAAVRSRQAAERTKRKSSSGAPTPLAFNVEAFLRGLDTRGKAELIEAIGKIVVAFPQTLELFGVAGFDETDDDDDGWGR